MRRFQAVYYRAADGTEPVNDFIDRLGVERRVALDNQIGRLNLLSDANPHLPHPYSSQVDGELRELRCHYGASLYRILYRRSGGLIVLLHVFAKASKSVPETEKRIARARWTDFKERMDAQPRKLPRAAGRDAP
jgi:phage-related protein